MALHSIIRLPAFADENEVNVIVETPQGSQNKFNFDPDNGIFELGGAMPTGVTFPFEFGFVPSTLGQDGDPMDLLILMDSPTFVGCLVKVRLIGVIEAEQTEKKGKSVRNDRLIGVATESRRQEGVRNLKDMPKELLAEIEHFFIAYNEMKGKKFKVLGCFGPKRARQLIRVGMKRAKRT